MQRHCKESKKKEGDREKVKRERMTMKRRMMLANKAITTAHI